MIEYKRYDTGIVSKIGDIIGYMLAVSMTAAVVAGMMYLAAILAFLL